MDDIDPKRKLFEAKGLLLEVDLDDEQLYTPCKWECGAELWIIPTPEWDPRLLALNPDIRMYGQFREVPTGLLYVGHSLQEGREWHVDRYQSHWCPMRKRKCKLCDGAIRIGLCPPERDVAGGNSLRFLNWEPAAGGVFVIDDDGYVAIDKMTPVGYEAHDCRRWKEGS